MSLAISQAISGKAFERYVKVAGSGRSGDLDGRGSSKVLPQI